MKASTIFLFFLLASCASQVVRKGSPAPLTPEVQKALAKAGIQPSDQLDLKVTKALTLINQVRYFYPLSGTPENLPPPFDNRYHLDSLRTSEEILKQKNGGYCGSAALVFAEMMRQSGVPVDDIQIVGGVYGDDLKVVCPTKGLPRVANPKTGASGHVFVALRFSNGWRLINTIDDSNYESVPWFKPEDLEQKMQIQPVKIPFAAYRNLPPHLRSRPMIVFQSWTIDGVPIHTFDQRMNLVASGLVSKKTCRYGWLEVDSSVNRDTDGLH